MFRKAHLKHKTLNLLMRRWHFCVLFDVNTMMAGKNQAALAVCAQTKVIFPFKWTASSEFGTYRLCEQRRFRWACASAQSRQNLRCSLIQAVSQEEPSDRKPDPWPLWMAEHAQLKFVMTECSKTQIRLTRPKWLIIFKTYNNYSNMHTLGIVSSLSSKIHCSSVLSLGDFFQ